MASKRGPKKTIEDGPKVIPEGTALSGRPKNYVFISHDHRDADLAEAFGNLLTDVSMGILKSFRSSDKKGTSGIEFGEEWYKAIMEKLNDATDVVALITENSLNRPWILYETGVAKGKLNTAAFGIALGIPFEKVNTGPFSQFHNVDGDEDSLTKLVLQLIRRNPEANPREEAVRNQVKLFLDRVSNILKERGKNTGKKAENKVDETVIAKIFEEVKVMVRQLPEKVDERVRLASAKVNHRRFRRFHPMMFEESLFSPKVRNIPGGHAISWVTFISLFKDDFPVLFELGMDIYRAIRTKNAEDFRSAKDFFVQYIEFLTREPMFKDFMFEDKETYMVMRHLPEMLQDMFHNIEFPDNKSQKAKSKQQN